ncbi:MAG: Z1 domain-containing protein [Balneola sp.]
MTTNTQILLNTLRASLENAEEITRDEIGIRVKEFADILSVNLSTDEFNSIVKKLQEEIQWTMGIGATLTDNSPHNKWVSQNREDIEWFYWNRYKAQLNKNGFGPTVVGKMDIVTDEVLDLLQNPKDTGSWERKGLVVGHVQSGKTANYAGLTCKALDAGYKVVIILAGLLNSLRRQTQGRIDAGVIGLDSSLMLEDIPIEEKLIGVGKIDHRIRPVSITTAHSDFNKVIATKIQTEIEQYTRPVVFVIKKNVSILKNLIDWLKNNNLDLSQHPMLLIDDEADHASINTKKEDLDPTKTNERIRELLDLFPKNVYLGYTATPFANIFINPDTPEEMMNDLFPENFIKTLDAPSNYFGGEKIFVQKELGVIREIDDYGDFLPLKHKKFNIPGFLPESLLHAIRLYVLVCSIRILRGQIIDHNSMLVNVSRFTDIQSEIRVMIHNYISNLRNAVFNYSSLEPETALKNSEIQALYKSWEIEFSKAEFDWPSIQNVLNKAISRIEVIEVNSSANAEKDIDYSKRNHPNGRHLIAVGGLSLSRGITLEGLSTSYFLRNSMMYDTLMQMGRWFGYRPGYEDLCRIFMTDNARSWYEHIANATEELRQEFRKMESLKKSPKDFGLAVRNHPESLIVTARNKMRSARTVIREIDLTGTLIETTRLFDASQKVSYNLSLANNLLKRLRELNDNIKIGGNHLLWENIPFNIIMDFVESFQNHPESNLTDSITVKQYVEDLAKEDGIKNWKVLFANPNSKSELDIEYDVLKIINPGLRSTTTQITAGIMLSQRKLAPGNFDRIDLEDGEIRESPLLMVHLLDCRLKSDPNVPIFPSGITAYGISFPGEKDGKRIKKLATYQVNTVWMREQYDEEIETDEDLEGDL